MNEPSVVSGDDSLFSEDECRTHTNGSEETDEDAEYNSTNGDSSSNAISKKMTEEITERESRNVARLRYIFLTIKLLVVVVVAFMIYWITKYGEDEEYQTQYDAASSKVMESFEMIVDHIGSMSSVGTAATIYSIDHRRDIDTNRNSNSTLLSWPFVSVSAFQQRTASARLLSSSLFMSINPTVTEEDRPDWESYVSDPENHQWIHEGLAYQEKLLHNATFIQNITQNVLVQNISESIFYFDDNNKMVIDSGSDTYLPSWMISPIVSQQFVNENLFRNELIEHNAEECLEHHEVIFGAFELPETGSMIVDDHESNHIQATSFYATLLSLRAGEEVFYQGDPMARLYIPVYDSLEENRTAVAAMITIVNWIDYFRNLLPKNIYGIHVVLDSACSGNFTYELNGPDVRLMGVGDLHESQYDSYVQSISLAQIAKTRSISDGTINPVSLSDHGCIYGLYVYPSSTYYDSTHSNIPMVLAISMSLVLLFTISLFLCYDRLVEKRQRIVLTKAIQSTSIITSLFPKQVHEQLLASQPKESNNSSKSTSKTLKEMMLGQVGTSTAVVEQQIADLYTNCTVMFADISGFTAWSSTRDPQNVFVLLQTIFNGFDRMAKRRKVFKVETIGDCYVAVTGLPEPQVNHAIIMARFASECRIQMNKMMKDLEKSLGPDCSDLVIRVGMNSGPVTAGVLQGDRARFQLFGDTVNTASRMESTGIRDKIQLSQSTADGLIAAGKKHWITERETMIEAKGKGSMQTFWLSIGTKKALSTASSRSDAISDQRDIDLDTSNPSSDEHKSASSLNAHDDKQDRLIDWMVDILLERLKPMISQLKFTNCNHTSKAFYQGPLGSTFLDEVQETMIISEFTKFGGSTCDVLIGDEIISDLRDYVSVIARMYHRNPFHNFEHACHVTMSVHKLLKRIISSETDIDEFDAKEDTIDVSGHRHSHAVKIHDFTYGICSDHIALFAVVFSALIHDVDHRGCSNLQLMKEEVSLGIKYRNQSVAEQNSLDIAWSLLMEDRFDKLRDVMFGSQEALLRFRQFVVNSVLATDIFDKELNDLRHKRWIKAFSVDASVLSKKDIDQSNRKATIVIEHILQASDVSHTMQHWQVYRKWNRLLFKEMYLAYQNGRMKVDPSTFWYQGELGFFDNYVIPLANKLKECAVFGVSSDEYLNYAVSNRAEWESCGKMIVDEMIHEISGD